MRFSKCGHDFATVLALNLCSMEIRLRVFITLTAKRRKKYHKFVHTLSHTHAQQYNRSIIFSLLRFEFCRFSLISLCFFPSSSSLLLFLSSFVIVFSLFALLCFVLFSGVPYIATMYMRRLFAYVTDLNEFSNDMVFMLSPLPIYRCRCIRTSVESLISHFTFNLPWMDRFIMISQSWWCVCFCRYTVAVAACCCCRLSCMKNRKLFSFFRWRTNTNKRKKKHSHTHRRTQMSSDLMKNYS